MPLSDHEKGTDCHLEVNNLTLHCVNFSFVPSGTVMYLFRTPISDTVYAVQTSLTEDCSWPNPSNLHIMENMFV